jgi:hypothetical protein
MAYRIRQLLGNPGLANYRPTAYLEQWLPTLLALKSGTDAPVVALG